MNYIATLEKIQIKERPKLKVGYDVKVGIKIIEGNKERVQFFQGTIISKNNSGSSNETITVRKILQGIGVERVLLVHSPKITSIVVERISKVRRSKLYYLKNLEGKATRLKEKLKKQK